MKNIAIIPARSGSKGLKDKNIKELAGKPMLAYTIEAALSSGCFAKVHVSTDSEQYAQIARHFGAEVPFLRSKELSGDRVGTWEVVKWILEQYEKQGQGAFDTVALLQPTSPLRTEEHIRQAYQLLKDKQANMIVGVCEAEHSPLWMNVLPEDGSMDGFLPSERLAAFRQGLPTYYRINGAIYIGKSEWIKSRSDYYTEGTYAYRMDKKTSIDVDDEWDFAMAQFLLDSVSQK